MTKEARRLTYLGLGPSDLIKNVFDIYGSKRPLSKPVKGCMILLEDIMGFSFFFNQNVNGNNVSFRNDIDKNAIC